MRHRQSLLAVGAAGAMVLAGITMASLPASAAAGCSVTYKVQSEWPGGFAANVEVTNLGDPVSGWTLGFDFPKAGQKVGQGWSATWSQSGTRVSATNLGWNGSLGRGVTTSVGFVGSWTDANPVPASFSLNGVTCTGTVPT
ncbi:MAG: cellulose-binding protein, partial [Saccharothrix sp.]|nr:cellulose-binding protein [Saccharothrix sp.]